MSAERRFFHEKLEAPTERLFGASSLTLDRIPVPSPSSLEDATTRILEPCGPTCPASAGSSRGDSGAASRDECEVRQSNRRAEEAMARGVLAARRDFSLEVKQ